MGGMHRNVKHFNGLYIIYALIIVIMDFFTYPHMLLNSLEGRSSPLVLTGTLVIGIFSLPACTMVSNVYV